MRRSFLYIGLLAVSLAEGLAAPAAAVGPDPGPWPMPFHDHRHAGSILAGNSGDTLIDKTNDLAPVGCGRGDIAGDALPLEIHIGAIIIKQQLEARFAEKIKKAFILPKLGSFPIK